MQLEINNPFTYTEKVMHDKKLTTIIGEPNEPYMLQNVSPSYLGFEMFLTTIIWASRNMLLFDFDIQVTQFPHTEEY